MCARHFYFRSGPHMHAHMHVHVHAHGSLTYTGCELKRNEPNRTELSFEYMIEERR